MLGLLCRLFGHDIMRTSASQRVCVRCGQREKLCNLGNLQGWVEITSVAPVSYKP